MRVAAFAVLVACLTMAGCTTPASPPSVSTPPPSTSGTTATTTVASTTPTATTAPPATTTPTTATPTSAPTLPPCPSATATGCDHNATASGGSGSAPKLYVGPYSAMGPGGSPTDCNGTGTVTFPRPPMNLSDFSKFLPLGIVVGGHVTPIDHAYFAPLPGAGGDAAPVYAIGDGTIVDIQTRPGLPGVSALQYRVWIVHTCTFYSYFDLATSLAPDIMAAWNATLRPDGTRAPLHVPIHAGEYLARVGGETLDFGVYNDEKLLPGFLDPALYVREPWKIHTDDPLAYFTPDVRAAILAKDARTAEPRAGRIDYDQDGRLVGNWFVNGTNGYAGVDGSTTPYATHASFAPDATTPDHLLVSLGDYGGQARQFAVVGNAPDFANVTVASGLVKYALVDWTYVNTTTDASYAQDPPPGVAFTWHNEAVPRGTLLVQLVAPRDARIEAFPDAAPDTVTAFDAGARDYVR